MIRSPKFNHKNIKLPAISSFAQQPENQSSKEMYYVNLTPKTYKFKAQLSPLIKNPKSKIPPRYNFPKRTNFVKILDK